MEATSSMFLSDLHEREVSLTPTLHHILERPVRDNYQHRGINEWHRRASSGHAAAPV